MHNRLPARFGAASLVLTAIVLVPQQATELPMGLALAAAGALAARRLVVRA